MNLVDVERILSNQARRLAALEARVARLEERMALDDTDPPASPPLTLPGIPHAPSLAQVAAELPGAVEASDEDDDTPHRGEP